MHLILAIAAGGAIGALLRHFINTGIMQTTGGAFPWGIFACNVLGSAIMGALIVVFALTGTTSQELRGFLTVGILGAFTTFSTFAMDAVYLLERGDYGAAIFYILGTVSLSIGGLLAGMGMMRLWLN